jgi:hypothetical protein
MRALRQLATTQSLFFHSTMYPYTSRWRGCRCVVVNTVRTHIGPKFFVSVASRHLPDQTPPAQTVLHSTHHIRIWVRGELTVVLQCTTVVVDNKL